MKQRHRFWLVVLMAGMWLGMICINSAKPVGPVGMLIVAVMVGFAIPNFIVED